MELATTAARNSIFSLIGFVYPTLLTIVVTPIFVHYLGPTRYGIYALSGVLFGFISLLDFGIAPTLLKFVSEHAALGEMDDLNVTVAATLVFYGLIGIAGLLIASTIAIFFVGDLFHLSGGLRSDAEFVLLVSGVSFLLSMLLSGLSSVPAGLQRFDLLTILGVALQTPAAVANILVLRFGLGLRGVTVVGAVGSAVGLLVFMILDRVLVPAFRPIPQWNREVLTRVFSFSSYAFVANLSGTVLFQLDKILIGALSGVNSVTYYTVPGNLAQRLHSATSSLSVTVLPLSSDLFARGDRERVSRLYRRATRFIVLFVCSLGIPLFVFAREILRYWLGSGFAANSTDVMRLLVVTYSILALTSIPYYVVMGAGKPRLAAVYTTAAAVLNVALVVILIPPFGIVGAAVAYLLSTIAVVPFIWYTERRVLEIECSDWPRIAVKLVVPALAQIGGCIALSSFVNSLLTLAVALCIGIPLLAVVFYLMGFAEPEDRALLARLVVRRG